MHLSENKTTKQKIYAFDTMRYLLAYCVVLGHTYIMLFKGDSSLGWCIQNLAVDGFFILSGFLIALSYFNSISINKDIDSLVIKSIINKIKRLYPEYIFATLFTLILLCIFFRKPHTIDILMNLVFMGQVNGSEGIVTGAWYISVLFWLNIIFVGLLYYCHKIAVYCIIPLMFFVAHSYCFAIYGGLSLNAYPLVDGYISAGFLKGIMGIGLGIETFFVCKYVKNTSFSALKYPSVYILLTELLCLYLLYYSFAQEQLSKRDFICYFAYPFLIGLYYFNKAILTKFFSWKIWTLITPTAYMLFLIHPICLEIIKKYIPYHNFPRSFVYISIMLFCGCFAVFCYHIQRHLFIKLKQILFIPQAENSSLNVENPERERERALPSFIREVINFNFQREQLCHY